jgi:hypothetical protein
MYQKAKFIQKGLIAAMAVSLCASSAIAANSPEGCVRTIVKEAQKFAQTKANAMRKCEDGVLKGKVTGPCPDSKNDEKISGAMSKAIAKINKKCETLDAVGNDDCVGAGDPDACCTGAGEGSCFPATVGYGDNCPRAACAGVVVSVADLADCVICNATQVTDGMVAQSYGPLNAPSTDKAVLNCQRTIGKEIVGAFRKATKIKQKCEDGIIKGKIVSCPDAKSSEKLTKVFAKLSEKIGKKCPDAATIEAAASLAGLYGGLGGLDNAGVAVDAVAEAQVRVALNDAVCGNAAIEAGEHCDDGNNQNDDGSGPADSCPADCTIGPCADGGNQQVTVSFTSASLIGDMTILLTYDDTVVSIPGSGNSPGVNGALSSGSFSFTPNDVDSALRMVLLDPSFSGVASGEAFVVQFNTCSGAPAPVAGDFQCFVVSAADEAFGPVTDATCSVSIP